MYLPMPPSWPEVWMYSLEEISISISGSFLNQTFCFELYEFIVLDTI